MTESGTDGVLSGVTVVEFAGRGPAPFAGMVLADMGAEVFLVERIPDPGAAPEPRFEVLRRGRRSVALDLRTGEGRSAACRLMDAADVVIEGFRPGVMERLGLGPEEALARNPSLVYGRMTGWGQDGEYAARAGHDLNYIGIAGVLGSVGAADGPPIPPANLVGDYGAGGMLLVMGVLGALLRARENGQGQVVDAAIVDGSAQLMASHWGYRAAGSWRDARGSNVFDGGAPHYAVYECADGRHLAIAPLEPKFWTAFLAIVGEPLDPRLLDPDAHRSDWPVLRQQLEERIRERTRAEWLELFDGVDACVSPVHSLGEAIADPHLRSRDVFVEIDGVVQPAPAPRFSLTPSRIRSGPPRRGADNERVLGASAGPVAR